VLAALQGVSEEAEVAAAFDAFDALDAGFTAQALCKESSWMAAKHVTISYNALARVGDGSGSSLINLEAQCCADGNTVVLMPQTLPAVSLHAIIGIP
jgi:hypothetical protein